MSISCELKDKKGNILGTIITNASQSVLGKAIKFVSDPEVFESFSCEVVCKILIAIGYNANIVESSIKIQI
jgi:hypothetical protein